MNTLAAEFKVHRQTVANYLQKLGISIRQPGLRADDLQSAIALYESGWSLSRIGETFGCNTSTGGVTLPARYSAPVPTPTGP